MNPISLEDQYRKIMADHITVSQEDLTSNEYLIINKGWSMFKDKLEDLKIANDEIKRLSIELANLKAMTDDKDERNNDNYSRGICPTCGRDESFRNDY